MFSRFRVFRILCILVSLLKPTNGTASTEIQTEPQLQDALVFFSESLRETYLGPDAVVSPIPNRGIQIDVDVTKENDLVYTWFRNEPPDQPDEIELFEILDPKLEEGKASFDFHGKKARQINSILLGNRLGVKKDIDGYPVKIPLDARLLDLTVDLATKVVTDFTLSASFVSYDARISAEFAELARTGDWRRNRNVHFAAVDYFELKNQTLLEITPIEDYGVYAVEFGNNRLTPVTNIPLVGTGSDVTTMHIFRYPSGHLWPTDGYANNVPRLHKFATVVLTTDYLDAIEKSFSGRVAKIPIFAVNERTLWEVDDARGLVNEYRQQRREPESEIAEYAMNKVAEVAVPPSTSPDEFNRNLKHFLSEEIIFQSQFASNFACPTIARLKAISELPSKN